MGYDKHNEEHLVMGSSVGPNKENIQHASDDTLKQIHSFIASFITMKKSLAIGYYGKGIYMIIHYNNSLQ